MIVDNKYKHTHLYDAIDYKYKNVHSLLCRQNIWVYLGFLWNQAGLISPPSGGGVRFQRIPTPNKGSLRKSQIGFRSAKDFFMFTGFKTLTPNRVPKCDVIKKHFFRISKLHYHCQKVLKKI